MTFGRGSAIATRPPQWAAFFISVLACFRPQRPGWNLTVASFELLLCDNKVQFCTFPREPNPRPLHGLSGELGYKGKHVIGKQYFVRQAAILFGIAKATKDPKLSAALMDKAADVKSKVDELGAPLDLSPQPPDIERPTT